jgi:hypothetical protein
MLGGAGGIADGDEEDVVEAVDDGETPRKREEIRDRYPGDQ